MKNVLMNQILKIGIYVNTKEVHVTHGSGWAASHPRFYSIVLKV